MPNESEQALLQRFVHGDRAAFETLFRQYEPEVHRWALRIVRDRSLAEDCVIEAFWRCYRSRARFDPARRFGPWIRRIATRASLDLLQASRRDRSMPAGMTVEAPLQSAGGSDVAEAHALQAAIGSAFDALPSKLRVVAALALIEQRPQAEIAEALGVPIGTVKSRLFRATRRIRKELEQKGVGE